MIIKVAYQLRYLEPLLLNQSSPSVNPDLHRHSSSQTPPLAHMIAQLMHRFDNTRIRWVQRWNMIFRHSPQYSQRTHHFLHTRVDLHTSTIHTSTQSGLSRVGLIVIKEYCWITKTEVHSVRMLRSGDLHGRKFWEFPVVSEVNAEQQR